MSDTPSNPPKLPPSRDTTPYKFDDGRPRPQQNTANSSGSGGPNLPPKRNTKPYKNGVQ